MRKALLLALASALSASAAAPQSGLIAHWPFDDGANPTADVAAGHGAQVLGATFTTADVAPLQGNLRALSFSEPGNHLVAADSAVFNFPSNAPRSISLWLKQTAVRGVFHVFGKRDGCGSTAGINYQLARDATLVHFGSASSAVLAGRDFPFNTWTHVVVVFDGASTTKLYFDGVEVAASTSFSMQGQNSAPLRIASSGTCPASETFPGLLDDVRIYDRVLQPEEITVLAGQGPPQGPAPVCTDPEPQSQDFAFTGLHCPDCLGADLELTVSDGTPSTAKGATITYKLSYANRGADSATGVVLTATVPANTTFDPTGSASGWQRVGTSNTYRLTLPELKPGQEGTALFAVKVSTTVPVGTVLSFSASIADDSLHGPDKIPADNAVADENLVTSGPTTVCGSITSDTLWKALDGPFIVTCEVVVPAGVTLTLEPGVVVKFNSLLGIQVLGSLVAQGTQSRGILFTSNRSRLRRGDWDGIGIGNGGTAVLDWTTVEYGGAPAGPWDANVQVAQGGSLTLRHAIVRSSDEYGLWVANGQAIVEDSLFADHDNVAIYVQTNAPANPTRVVRNTFSSNRSYPISVEYADGATAEIGENGGSGNKFASVRVSGTLAGDAAWALNPGLTYLVSGDLTVARRGKLSLGPGIVVKLETAASDLFVDGTLAAEGSEAEPVVFTSFKDDSAGGDTNGDGTATVPAPGDWGQIRFNPGSRASRLDHAVVAYGASTTSAAPGQARIDSEGVSVSDSVFRGSRQAGLHVTGAASLVRGSRFEGNLTQGLHLALTSNRGLLLEGNTFLGNGQHAVLLDLAHARGGITLQGNAASGNQTNGVAVQGDVQGDFSVDASGQSGFALRLLSDLTVGAGATLMLSPGTVLKSESAAADLHVFGRLVADGTFARRIVFTSFKDDSFGGDTNGDGGASTPAAGDWGQVWLRTGSSGSVLRNAVLAYGGATGQPETFAILRTDTPSVLLSDVTVRRSRQHGIYAASTALSLARVTVENSFSSGLYVNVLTGTADMSLEGSSFLANAQHAVFLDLQGVTGKVVAQGNTVSGNGTNGVAVQGSFVGPFLFDWTGQNGFALRLAGDLTVRPGAALTLSPGVVVKGGAADHEVRVEGSLIARGTAARPIVFTSLKDDSAGGDTNGDSSATSPAPGDWGQVWLRPGSTGNVLEEVVLAYGGATGVADVAAGLRVDSGRFSLVGGAVRKSKQHGVYAHRSSGEIRDVDIEDNAQTGAFFNDLAGNVEVTLEGSRFLRNGDHAAFLDLEATAGTITVRGNTATGNLVNGIGIQGLVGGPLALDWSGQTDLPLRLNADVTVRSGAVLILSPGMVVKAGSPQHDLIIDGSLVARGTADQPVVFTSVKDDSRGGDTNRDGAASAPSAGDWGQVWLRAASSANVLEHCVLAWGGAVMTDTLADLRIDTPGVSATSCTFERSAQSGVRVTGIPPPLFSGNRLQSNTGNGLTHAGSGILDARNNWWGAPSGPFHPTLNPAGQGNRVSDNVLFDPWLTSPEGAPLAPPSPLLEPQPPEAPAQAAVLVARILAPADVTAPVAAAAMAAVNVVAPPRPSSFFGRITVGGSALVPPGTRVSAWIGGIRYAETFSLLSGNESVYRLDVPGDIESTSAVEGGRPGDTIVFRVAGVAVPQTEVWQDGLYRRLDLTAAVGPDLAVTQTDGRDRAASGDTITYTITAANLGEGTASGVAIRDTLPDGTTFVGASDGGTTAGRVVTWPAFDLADGASVTRTVAVRIAASLPAGAETLVNMVTVADDGAHGVDPDPANNSVQDSDALDAAPDLAIAKTDGLTEVLPGTTLRYVLTITNRGTQGATGVRVIDTLPEHLTFFAASDSGAESGLTIDWPPFDLAAGATVKREISGRVDAPLPADLTALVNTAAVTDDGANGADPNPADNSATDTDTLLRKPDLAVPEVDASQNQLNLESLALSGDVLVRLENRGTLEVATPFEVTVFEDTDGDGDWAAGTDNLLGQQTYSALLAAGQSVPFAVPVFGTVAFRGNRIFAFVDSAAAVAELDETNNVGSTASGCETMPAVGAFQPRLELNWPRPGIVEPNSVDSASSPVVVNLTDDNGDGKIDGKDVPDIVFTSANLDPALTYYDPSVLRALSGDTGEAVFDVPGFFSGYQFFEFLLTTVAVGDIDLDHKPEIVTTNLIIPVFGEPYNVITAYENDGRRKWQSPVYTTNPSGRFTNRDNSYIADIDRNGVPEIVVGAHVFNNNGTLRWKGTGGQGFQSIFNGDNPASGAISIVADLDLTGNPEIVTGNTAYRSDGSIYWQIPYDDGFPAVANFDDDPFPEIVVVSHGKVRLHEHDGTLKWGPVVLPGKTPVAGGTPTVADFDADGQPEIGVAGSDFYTVFETDGTVKWQRKTQDFSSGMTGSTVFDFDGDGRFEVVYRDEVYLRVYRGEDGTVLFQYPVPSTTLNEQPTVADVDKDGNAEILVTADHGYHESGIPGNASNAGLRVFGDANDNWVGTRAIWNQHAYSVGNVNDDATIPRDPDWSWLSHNTFRAQIPPPGVAFSSPDLTVSRGRVDVTDFPRSLRITARLGNGGSTSVAPGISMGFYSGDPSAGGTLLGTAIAGRLGPGGFEDVSFTWTPPPLQPATIWIVADAESRERECDEANNVYAFGYSLADVGLFLRKDDGRASIRFADETTYTLTADNFAPHAATGVVLTDVLPPHTTFVSASDGGEVAGGVVTWPPFTLESGARATRTVTVKVVGMVPAGVDTLTNTASVTDDGSHGPDPTPGNNTASDTDELLAFRAEAGGPYAGGEGEAIALDASGTADPESRIVRYEWDLDGDGAFDDATGITATATFPDQGVYTVTLRVTDAAGRFDIDSAQVTVANRPPAVDAGDDRTVLEGDRLSLSVPF
ncbi:MAG TPA: right-handed parallel beta-helix repeat-containing protein, partial [Thermoanaerobaculia bacterium]|nr:right-handed parallel beta-helix repeat-containing protein [Thermoanaerobaculia bacterium]